MAGSLPAKQLLNFLENAVSMDVDIILTSRGAENGFGSQLGGGDSGPPARAERLKIFTQRWRD